MYLYVCGQSPIIAGLVKDSLAPGCSHGGSSASDICRHENNGIRLTILCICLYLFVCIFFMCIACIYAYRLFGQNYDLEEMTQRLLQNEYAWGEGAPTTHDNYNNTINNNNNTYTSPAAQVYKHHSLTNSSTWDQPPPPDRMGHNYDPCGVSDGDNDEEEESGSSSFDVPIFSGLLLSQSSAGHGHGHGDDGEYEPDNVN